MSFDFDKIPPKGTPEHQIMLDKLGIGGIHQLLSAAHTDHLVLPIEKQVVTRSDIAHTFDIARGVVDGFRENSRDKHPQSADLAARSFYEEARRIEARARGETTKEIDNSEYELGRQIAEVLPYVLVLKGVSPPEWFLFYSSAVPKGIIEASPSGGGTNANESTISDAAALMSGPTSAIEILLNTLIPGWIDLDADGKAEGVMTVIGALKNYADGWFTSMEHDPSGAPAPPAPSPTPTPTPTPSPPPAQTSQGPLGL